MTVLCWPGWIHQPQELSAVLKDRMVMLGMTVLCWPGWIHQPQELSAVLKDRMVMLYDSSVLAWMDTPASGIACSAER